MFLSAKCRATTPVTGKSHTTIRNFWMYLVILAVITSCVANQGPLTTVTPPPHRGAARQMYGSGSLRPPGSNPLIPSPGRSSRPSPSPPPLNPKNRHYQLSYPIVPLPIPSRDFDTIPEGFPIFIHDFFPPRDSSPRSSARNTGMYGGRPEYYGGRPDRGYPRRYPMDPGFIPGRGYDRRPDHGVIKFMPPEPMEHGIQNMREPTEEEGTGQSEDSTYEHMCGSSCRHGEFMCVSSCTCIKEAYRCDGDIDCDIEEDELGCGEIDEIRTAKCLETDKYVRCPHFGKCIKKEWLCDGDDDCGDYSDETHCGFPANCTVDQFECANGLCIPKSWLCDNDNDCKDFSDELNCTKTGCTEDEFTCSDGSCISLSWKCDREADCNDGSDEKDCDIEPPSCHEGEFQCTYQKCIKKEFTCDGDNDCGDWSDEDDECTKNPGSCVSGEFMCKSGRCIPENWRCDKQQDCDGEDNEDEINCTKTVTRTCSPDEYACKSGECILKTWVCDGVSDCRDDEDESNCQIVCDKAKFACSSGNPNETTTEFCINKKHVCDGQRDCPKGEDESNCPTKHDCDKDSKCTQVCITKADKEEGCACHPGYSLAKDGYSCDDVNECLYETDPVCSQTCNNTIGSFKCGCMTGYILRPDLRSCKALGASPTLLFANRVDIRQVSLSNAKYTAILKGLHNAIALDYHYSLGLIFWSDVSMDVIRRAYINGSGISDVIKWGLESPGGVALDWIHDLLFWTDSGTRRVEVASIDGRQRAIIVASDLDKPRAIVVHPGEALIFWTDWGPNPKIERIEMDGSNRKSIITESVFWPNGLTLDYTNNRIYWADAKHNVIETSLYDGSDRKKVISKGLPHPFALTIFEDAIYWTDWHTKAISTANKATGAGLRTIHSNLHFPMDIHSYHPQRQPAYKSHCGPRNGGCEHLCLPNRKSYTCKCRMGQKLKADGRTCLVPEKLLIFARKKDLRVKHLDSETPQNDEIVIDIDGIKSAVAVAWDSRNNTIFWTDVEKNTISKANWNGSNQTVIIKTNTVSPAGLAFDWLTNKLYWTDAGTAKIEVSTLDGSIRAVLIWKDLEKPRDIVVDPTAGYMYWSDWGERPKIEKAAMDGQQRSIFIIHNLTWPNGLAIDHDTGRLYWSDGGSSHIEYCNLDGTNRRVLLGGESVPHPFGLDVFGDYIYWTDWETFNIERANKNTGLNRTIVSAGLSDLMDVRVFHRSRQYKSTSCDNHNGGCSHLCLLKPNGHSCACPRGINLKEDDKTCMESPMNALIVAHGVDIRQISLDVPYIIDVVLPFPTLKNAVSVDVDRRTGEVYWTDTADDTITKSSPDGKNLKKVVSHEMQMAEGIAIDFVGGKIYWTDGERNSIEVAELDGSNRKLLIWYDLDSPRPIALHYHLGLMFWCQWGKSAKIEVAEMDGSNRKSLITKDIEWPNGLAIDHQTGRMYWSDAKFKKIESSDLEGKNRKTVVADSPHPYGVVVAGNNVYWTDWQKKSLQRADKTNGADRKVIVEELKGLMDVRSVQSGSIEENVCGSNNGGCSHLCLRNADTFSCACPTGINLLKDSSTECEFQPTNYLLFATRKALARISLDSEEWDVTLPIQDLQYIIDVDFHWEKKLIIITDVEAEKITSINMRNFSDRHHIVSTNISTPNGVTVDWISDNIFWTDEGRKVIEVAKIDGSMRKILIDSDLVEPRSIAVFPRKGLLYWSDWGAKPKIEMSYSDGTFRKVIVESGLGFPNGLMLDFKAKRLYWADAKWDRVETSDLNGGNRIQLVHSSTTPNTRPFSLTQFGDYLYWTDWFQKSIVRADKGSGKNFAIVRGNLDGALGITTVSESRQKGWNPCAVENGGCTHFCLFKKSNYTCACPDIPTSTTCKTEPTSWVPLTNPEGEDEYEDEYNDEDPSLDFDDGQLRRPHMDPSLHQIYMMILFPLMCIVLLVIVLLISCILYRKSRKKFLYATGRSVMTFSNPNYYTSNNEPAGTTAMVDRKPFLWRRLKYDKSQERVYEDKAGSSSPEVASLIPAVLTPSSSNCEAVTPELERSPSITPLHRLNSMTQVV